MGAMSQPRWKPSITVSAIIEREGRFLVIEEHTRAGLRINTPAGHLEPGESPAEGAAREALEETGHPFTPTELVGIYLAASPNKDGEQTTWVRFAFCGTVGACTGQPLDEGIVRTLWLTREVLLACRERHRSTLVMQCIDDSLAGQRHPLGLIQMDASARDVSPWV